MLFPLPVQWYQSVGIDNERKITLNSDKDDGFKRTLCVAGFWVPAEGFEEGFYSIQIVVPRLVSLQKVDISQVPGQSVVLSINHHPLLSSPFPVRGTWLMRGVIDWPLENRSSNSNGVSKAAPVRLPFRSPESECGQGFACFIEMDAEDKGLQSLN